MKILLLNEAVRGLVDGRLTVLLQLVFEWRDIREAQELTESIAIYGKIIWRVLWWSDRKIPDSKIKSGCHEADQLFLCLLVDSVVEYLQSTDVRPVPFPSCPHTRQKLNWHINMI